jgi:phospholipase/carboxylesterase
MAAIVSIMPPQQMAGRTRRQQNLWLPRPLARANLGARRQGETALNRRAFGFAAAAGVLFGGGARAQSTHLDGPRQPPLHGPARNLIVLLHGFGSDGADMIDLAPSLQPYAPSAAFAAPNGPYRQDGGYSWFAPANGARTSEAERQARAAAGGGPALQAFIDAELARYELAPERLILVGFSQGGSTSLNSGLRLRVLPEAIVAFSGANLSPAGLPREGRLPKVLLIQGDQDPRVAPGAQQQALRVLMDIGAKAEGHILPGLGHAIDDRGLRLAGEFIRMIIQAQA